ncbi:MAG: hypothetical protein ACKV2Q_16990 [Planctomycetaceae bacterium]
MSAWMLGRNSLVGTTVRNANQLPEHLVADARATWWTESLGGFHHRT